jgi:hypothetical protein
VDITGQVHVAIMWEDRSAISIRKNLASMGCVLMEDWQQTLACKQHN